MAHTEIVAVLITDLVGSTELEMSLGAAESDKLRRVHFGLLRRAMSGTGGREVKTLGDGLMIVFSSVGGAVRCGVRMQQAIERHARRGGRQLQIRVAIAVGDATAEDGDYFGLPVIQAARLVAATGPDVVIVSEAVRQMAGDHVRLEPVGELTLKGLPDPLPSWNVTWEPLTEEAEAVPLPSRLATVPPTAYIGRAEPRTRLREAWKVVGAGAWRMVLVAGEPGIGKTRLMTHLAVEVREQGGCVLYGRCDEMSAPYAPFVEAFDHLARHAPEDLLAEHVERHGGALARIAPSLAERLPSLPAPRSSDPESDRWMLFGATADLLARAARERPVLLLLDDLHWADLPSLGLLRHLTGAGRADGVLVAGTFRSTELGPAHPLTAVLGDLRRESGIERLDLSGLTEAEVGTLVTAVAGQAPDEAQRALAAALYRETDGNPLFVGELLLHLAESGRVASDGGRWRVDDTAQAVMPQSVVDVIDGRVSRLGEHSASLLATASVIGREFDLSLLADAAGADRNDVLEVLEQAGNAAIVAESGEDPEHYAFVHALFNHTLYAGLSAARRASLHAGVAEALERRAGSDPAPIAGLLAHHCLRAAPAIEPLRAVRFAQLAGEQALAKLAPGEAVRWFGQALDVLGQMAHPDRCLRCDLLTDLGEAQRQSGDPDFRQTLLQAGELGRDLGDGERTARAALANTRGYFASAGIVDEERIAILRAAAELLPQNDQRRARILALLALELVWDGDYPGRRALVAEAIAIARTAGDPADLAQVLFLSVTGDWGPHNSEERVARTSELTRIAATVADPVLEFWAAVWHGGMSAHVGDLEAADRCLARQRALVAQLGQPALRYSYETQVALRTQISGTVDEAEAAATRAMETGTAIEQPDAISLYVPQLLVARRAQGRLDEVIDLLRQVATSIPGVSQFAALCAAAEIELGNTIEASEMLDAAGTNGFRDIPLDPVWLTGMVHWAEVAARLGARDHALALREILEPVTQVLPTDVLAACPVVDHYRGMLDAAIGEPERAEARLRAALTAEERMGARGFAARTRLELGRLQLAGGEPERAAAMLEEASREAGALGLATVARDAQGVLATC